MSVSSPSASSDEDDDGSTDEALLNNTFASDSEDEDRERDRGDLSARLLLLDSDSQGMSTGGYNLETDVDDTYSTHDIKIVLALWMLWLVPAPSWSSRGR